MYTCDCSHWFGIPHQVKLYKAQYYMKVRIYKNTIDLNLIKT